MITVRQTEVFKKWFNKIKDNKTQMIITARLRRLSVGNFGDSKTLGQSLSELRIDYGPGYRIYFTQKGKEIVILLSGGDKSTQESDIKKARKLLENLEE